MKKYTSATNNIGDMPLDELYREFLKAENKKNLITEFAAAWGLKKKPWFISQISAYFAKNFPAVKRDGLYNIAATLGSIDDFGKGCYIIAQHSNRSDFITSMGTNSEYCSLVPLVLGSYKRYDNIPYSSWDKESLKAGMPTDLYECLQVDRKKYLEDLWHYCVDNLGFDDETKYSREELLRAVRADLEAGVRYTIAKKGTPFEDYNKLFTHIELQSWCAHPSIRHKYMILDLVNLDKMPEPLESYTNVVSKSDMVLPWDLPQVKTSMWEGLPSSLAPVVEDNKPKRAPKKVTKEDTDPDAPPWMT